MRRIILAALAVMLTSGVALADRRPDRRDHDRGRHTERYDRTKQHRDNRVHRQDWRRHDNRDHRRVERRGSYRRPIYVSGNRYSFGNGRYYTYRRPVIKYRYRNYYQRPAVIVESYDPVPGYIWVQGNWQWNGVEWIWQPGHYEVDATSYDTYYYDINVRL